MFWLWLFLAFFAGWTGRSLRHAQLQRRWARRAFERSMAESHEKVTRLFNEGLRETALRILRNPPRYQAEERPDRLVEIAQETLDNERQA